MCLICTVSRKLECCLTALEEYTGNKQALRVFDTGRRWPRAIAYRHYKGFLPLFKIIFTWDPSFCRNGPPKYYMVCMVSTTVVQGKTLIETKTSTQILWKIQSRIASTFRKWILISSTKVFSLGRCEPEVPEILEIDDCEDEEVIEILDDNCEEIPSSRQRLQRK